MLTKAGAPCAHPLKLSSAPPAGMRTDFPSTETPSKRSATALASDSELSRGASNGTGFLMFDGLPGLKWVPADRRRDGWSKTFRLRRGGMRHGRGVAGEAVEVVRNRARLSGSGMLPDTW